MKKLFVFLFVLCLIVLPFGICVENSFADTEKIIINTSYSYLYKDSSFSEHYDFKIPANKILICLNESEDYYEVNYEFNEENYQGFIPAEFASPYSSSQEIILTYNGRIIRECEVFDIITDEKIENISLKPGHKIYLYEGFDAKKEYTNIKFRYEDTVIVGKVLTTNLSPNGINKGVIIGISMIIAIVGVILILLGITKTKKWHKRLKSKKK